MQTQSDYEARLKELYKKTKGPIITRIPKMKYLFVNGSGDPAGQDFQDAVGALYSTIYTIKFMPRKGVPIKNFFPAKVAPLEGQWWVKGKEHWNDNRDLWQWRIMIMVPDYVNQSVLKKAVASVEERGKGTPKLKDVYLESWTEGYVVQQLHLGSFSKEAATIEDMHEYAKEQGYDITGKHHEIYLSDPRRTAEAKLKTILRHPVKKAK